MGLADILSNPGIIGLAMAGLSRDPDAPYRTFGVMQGANDMARQAQMDEEKKLAKADTLRMTQDMLGGANQESNALMNVLARMQDIQKMPETQVSTQAPLGGAPEGYPAEVPNEARMAETKQFYADLQKINHPAEAAIDFTKYPNADPAIAISLAANKFSMRKEMVKELFAMASKEQELNQQHKNKLEEITLTAEEARKTNAAKGGTEKTVNMPPIYDKIGTYVLGSEYHTLAGQRKFAEMVKSDPKIQKMIDAEMSKEADLKFRYPPIVNYLQTNEGFVPVSGRNPPSPIGQPVPGIGRPLTGEQVTTQQQIGTLGETLGRVKTLFKYDDKKGIQNTDWVGPITGRAAGVQENWVGGLPEEQTQAYADLASMQNQLVYLYSGKQINENEFKRLKAALPSKEMPVSTFNSRMRSFEATYNSIINERNKGLAAGGHLSPPGQVNQNQGKPKTPGQPKTIKYDANGNRIE